MDGQIRRAACAFLLLLLLLLVLIAANLLAGTVQVTPAELLGVLRARGEVESTARVVWTLRLPRLLAAAFLGGALAVSGFLLQTFFFNPIAGPFVLGISSGAKLTVALTLIAAVSHGRVLGSAALIGAAFCGSMLSMGLILLFSAKIRRMSLLIVCGVMIGYICSAATEFAVTFADDANIVNLHNWSMGSFSGIRWENLRVIAAVTAVGVGLSFLLSKPMGAWQLGESYAQNLGVNLRRFQPVRDGQTPRDDPGLLSRRRGFLPVLRSAGTHAVSADRAEHQRRDGGVRRADRHLDAAEKKGRAGGCVKKS